MLVIRSFDVSQKTIAYNYFIEIAERFITKLLGANSNNQSH